MGRSDPKYADWQRDAITRAVHQTVPRLSIKRAVAAAARGDLGVEPFEVPYSTAAGWCQQHQGAVSEPRNGHELGPELEPEPSPQSDDGGGKALETHRQLQEVLDGRVARLVEKAEADPEGFDLETELRRIARMQGELEKLRRQATWKQPSLDPAEPPGDEPAEEPGSDLVAQLVAAVAEQDEQDADAERSPAAPRQVVHLGRGEQSADPQDGLSEEQRDTIGRAVNEWGIPPDRVASVAGMGLLGYAGGEGKTLPPFDLTEERAREVAAEWADAQALEAGAA